VAHGLAHEPREALEDARRHLIAHRLRQRREAREIDEGDRDAELARHLARLPLAGVRPDMEHGVLPHRFLPALAMEVEDRGLDERGHLVAGPLLGVGELASGETQRLQALVDVEVEDARLGLRHPAEGVGIHPHELEQRLLGEAGVQTRLDPVECLYVPLVEQLSLLGEPGGFPEPPHDIDAEAQPLGRLGQRVGGSDAFRKVHDDVACEEAFFPVRLGDRLDAEPAAQQELDEPRPLHVLGGERLGAFATDEPERSPFVHSLDRLTDPTAELERCQPVAHGQTVTRLLQPSRPFNGPHRRGADA